MDDGGGGGGGGQRQYRATERAAGDQGHDAGESQGGDRASQPERPLHLDRGAGEGARPQHAGSGEAAARAEGRPVHAAAEAGEEVRSEETVTSPRRPSINHGRRGQNKNA